MSSQQAKERKYLDLVRELRKLWNMTVTVIPIVIDALGTVPKDLENGIEEVETRERIATIGTTASLRSVKILKRVLETSGDLLSLRLL